MEIADENIEIARDDCEIFEKQSTGDENKKAQIEKSKEQYESRIKELEDHLFSLNNKPEYYSSTQDNYSSYNKEKNQQEEEEDNDFDDIEYQEEDDEEEEEEDEEEEVEGVELQKHHHAKQQKIEEEIEEEIQEKKNPNSRFHHNNIENNNEDNQCYGEQQSEEEMSCTRSEEKTQVERQKLESKEGEDYISIDWMWKEMWQENGHLINTIKVLNEKISQYQSEQENYKKKSKKILGLQKMISQQKEKEKNDLQCYLQLKEKYDKQTELIAQRKQQKKQLKQNYQDVLQDNRYLKKQGEQSSIQLLQYQSQIQQSEQLQQQAQQQKLLQQQQMQLQIDILTQDKLQQEQQIDSLKLQLQTLTQFKNKIEAVKVQTESQMEKGDLELLQRAYWDERSERLICQGKLLGLLDNMKEMQKKQSDRKGRVDKLKEDISTLQIDLKQSQEHHIALQLQNQQTTIASFEGQISKLNESQQALQSNNSFLTQEIQSLAQQISHLLKINFLVKYQIKSHYGIEQYTKIIKDVKQCLAGEQQFDLLEKVDELYGSSFSTVYNDIKEIIEHNRTLKNTCSQLQKQLSTLN